MRRTKIVCTIGPSTETREGIIALVNAGMNVVRLNFSHGSYDWHKKVIDLVKEVRKEMNVPLALMLDTKGPEIRIRTFKDGKATLVDGSQFVLTTDQSFIGNKSGVAISYEHLPQKVHPKDTILIADGAITLEVVDTTEKEVITRIIHGGTLSDRKSINVPGVKLGMEYLSEQDKSDLLFGVQNDVDFISASFVRSKEDVIALRKFINFNNGHDIRIISKIENMEGIENFDEILEHSDGIMVARGDMGVEVDFTKLPGIQKRFIKRCYQAGKMVITATQMLESMINNPTPTRAEITDVANAVFDGTSAVMLSGETAMGKYPIKSVNVMAQIAEQAEKDVFEMNIYDNNDHDIDYSDTTNAICDAACLTARDVKATAIIAHTRSGKTARRMSKFRPFQPIVAATPVEKTFHQLALSWGVYPVLSNYQTTADQLFMHAIDCAQQLDLVKVGDKVVVSAGIPAGGHSETNIMKVETVNNDVN